MHQLQRCKLASPAVALTAVVERSGRSRVASPVAPDAKTIQANGDAGRHRHVHSPSDPVSTDVVVGDDRVPSTKAGAP